MAQNSAVRLKSAREIEAMRRAGSIVAAVLEMAASEITPGVTTGYLDEKAYKLITRSGGRPAFKGYKGFPATLCTSLNEVIVHGIPGKERLKDGDIISIDVGVLIDGYYGDTAATFPVGRISAEAARLINVTREALSVGIGEVRIGSHISNVSHAIQSYVESKGFAVIRDFVGHGIGSELHEPPEVPNFGEPNMGVRIQSGMALAIEPMVCAGRYDAVIREDGWTAATKDGSLAAHFEHTIAVTDDGVEILTICQKKKR